MRRVSVCCVCVPSLQLRLSIIGGWQHTLLPCSQRSSAVYRISALHSVVPMLLCAHHQQQSACPPFPPPPAILHVPTHPLVFWAELDVVSPPHGDCIRPIDCWLLSMKLNNVSQLTKAAGSGTDLQCTRAPSECFEGRLALKPDESWSVLRHTPKTVVTLAINCICACEVLVVYVLCSLNDARENVRWCQIYTYIWAIIFVDLRWPNLYNI